MIYDVHADHLDTPRALTDSSGTIVWRAAYRAYGLATVEDDPDGDSTTISFPIRFPGQYSDGDQRLAEYSGSRQPSRRRSRASRPRARIARTRRASAVTSGAPTRCASTT